MLRVLLRARYERAFEPGCSVGEFTALLARRCNAVLATDISATAVERARRRCAAFSHVNIRQADLADGPPKGPFDLIVLSEIGYYFSKVRWANVALAAASQLGRGGQLLAVHWLGVSEDHVLHGDEVHRVLHDVLPLCRLFGERHKGYRLDNWQRS
jgi:protein-L-isoaspartate O-methyltransferase